MLDEWCSVKSTLPVTEVALGDLHVAFGMRDEGVDGGEETKQLAALPGLLTY